MPMADRKAATVALLALNGALLVVLWFQFSIVPTDVRAAAAVRNAAPKASLQLPAGRPALPPLKSYQELIERPLFWSERRSQQDGPTAVEATPVQLPFVLLGVALAKESHAVLGRTGSKEVRRVYVGDVIEGWTVEAMSRDSVTVSANGVRRELQFDEGKASVK